MLEKARIKAGLTPEAAAKRLRVTVPYLRSIELGTIRASFVFADRAAPLYGLDIKAFALLRKTTRKAP